MKETSQVTALVVDSGLYLPLALRLAEEYKRVIYWNPDQRAFPSLKQACIGDGFETIERVDDFWPLLDELDLAVFPDCQLAGLQEHLKSIGIPVWGSGRGVELETKREHFMAVLEMLGLDLPKFEVLVGPDALRDHICTREDVYVKISKYRGDMETFHWRNWNMDSGWLEWLAVNLGPVGRRVRFLVFDAIDTPLEIGADLYSVDGSYPKLMLNGIEGKDKCYFSAVTEFEKMPEQIKCLLIAISGKLSDYHYRNQISMEVRVKGDLALWIDATQRGGKPSTESQCKLWKNFPDIVYHGAHGILVDPIPAGKFSIECMITTKENKDCWDVVEIPKELEPWAQFSNCAFIDGCYCFPPDEMHGGDLGWLVAIGDTPREVLDRSKELADLLPEGLNADVEALADIIKEIDTMAKADIPFSEQTIPEPATVLE